MPMKNTHDRDNGYNGDLRTEVEALSRKFNELEMLLRNYLEQANDEKIKSNRRLQDTLYNLDDDHVPGLTIIRKKTFKNGESIAALNFFADETKAEIKQITEWKGSITDNNGELKVVNSLATFEQHVSNTYAKSETLTKFEEETTKSIASIEQVVTKDSAKISLLVSTDSDGQNKVEGGIIVEAINNGDTKASINADKIALNGEVTLSSWCADDDVTVINGGKIKAKSITADQIDASDLKVKTAAIAESMVIHDAEGNTLFSAADNNVIIAGFTVEGNYLRNVLVEGEGDQTESTVTILSENGFSQSYSSYGAEDYVSISSGSIMLGLVGHGDIFTRPYPFMSITFDNDVFYGLYLDFETNTVKFS